MDWQRLFLYIIIILTFWKAVSPKITPPLKENKPNNPSLSLSGNLLFLRSTTLQLLKLVTFPKSSSQSPCASRAFLLLDLSLVHKAFFHHFLPAHNSQLICLPFSFLSSLNLTSPDLGSSAILFLRSTFNILPWRSFNISPTGQNFPRLSELQRVERETPVISPNCNINSFCTAYMHIMQCPLSFSFYDNMEYYFHFCDDGSFP